MRTFCTEAKEVKNTIIYPETCESLFGQIGGLTMFSMVLWVNIDSFREESNYSKPSGLRQLGQTMLIGPPLYFLGRGTGRMVGQHFILSKNVKMSLAIMASGIGLTAYNS